MAASFNKVLLLGNLTRDPEVRYTPKGTAVGDLAMAINETFKAADGSWKESVVYVDVEVWERQAENCKQYLTKGSPIFVEGKLKLDTWEQDGQKKSKLRVRAERVQFLSSGGGRSGGSQGGGGNYGGEQRERSSGDTGRVAQRPPSGPPPSDDRPPTPTEDDVPF